MSAISDLLNKIKTAIYGKEVRGAIHDAIEQSYNEASQSLTNSAEALRVATEVSEQMADLGDPRLLIAKVEETNVASSMHLIGEYIIFKNAIYQTRAIINPGDTITPGVNLYSLPVDGGMATALAREVEPLQFTVRFNGLQTISDTGKRFVRTNIDAVGSDDLSEVSNFVANGNETIDLSDYEQSVTPSRLNGVLSYTISGTGTVVKTIPGNFKSYQIERKKGRTALIITANSTKNAMVTFANQSLPNSPADGADLSDYICSGTEPMHIVSSGATEYIPFPSDCAYVIIRRSFGSSAPDWAPSSVSMTTDISHRIDVLEEEIADLSALLRS